LSPKIFQTSFGTDRVFLFYFYSILLALMIIPRPQLLAFGDILLHHGISSSNLWLAAFISDFS
jgi:hypothetical protein